MEGSNNISRKISSNTDYKTPSPYGEGWGEGAGVRVLPPEWHPQSFVQLTWPHAATDWADILPEVEACYLRIAREIALRESLLIVTPEPLRIESLLRHHLSTTCPTDISLPTLLSHIYIIEAPTDDTWARDHAFLTVLAPSVEPPVLDDYFAEQKPPISGNPSTEQQPPVLGDYFAEPLPLLIDFRFNGWGQKFAAAQDNQICRRLAARQALSGTYEGHLDFTLEGGSIESDGQGTLLTTTECLLAPNRNEPLNQEQIEQRLKDTFGAKRVLWLDHGYLAGDDTDSHIDTLARLCPNDTIAYVQCTDPQDEHYPALSRMEAQLRTFRTLDGRPYRLIPLPMAAPEYACEPSVPCDSAAGSECPVLGDSFAEPQRLPATYANFLAINTAVLLPTYGHEDLDTLAAKRLQEAFPNHEIVPIDCRILIEQHGSLHCCTMQFPQEVTLNLQPIATVASGSAAGH